jgi:uncharacterized protein YecT (DUF1311 family)
MNSNSVLKQLVVPVIVIAFAVLLTAGFMYGLRQLTGTQPALAPVAVTPSPTPVSPASAPTLTTENKSKLLNSPKDEEGIVKLIENLPDIKLLNSIPSLEEMRGAVHILASKDADLKSYVYNIEVQENLTTNQNIFARFRYDYLTGELIRTYPEDKDSPSVIDKQTGEVKILIHSGVNEEERWECDSGPQLVLNFCANTEFRWADQLLNIVYQRIIMDTTILQEKRDTLKKAEETWIKQKEEKCAPKLIEYDNGTVGYDGSIQPLLSALCKESMTRERIKELIDNYLR